MLLSLVTGGLLGAVAASAAAIELAARAAPDAPSHGYAPMKVQCPQGSERPTIREAGSLSGQEKAWLDLRRKHVVLPLVDFLDRAGIPGFDGPGYVETLTDGVPTVAIAVSGGGYRALLNGAGFLAAADSRTANMTEPGGLGGLLQSSTYVAGLSGGGWLVGSVYMNNFSSVEALRDGSPGSDVWRFDRSIFSGPDGESRVSIFNSADYWAGVADQVGQKQKAGYNSSVTDYWGRGLSYQLINDTDGGPAYTWSSIAYTDAFVKAQVPFPILVANNRAPDTKIVSLNSTVIEFNPYETGSWDPTTYGFAPTRFLGSNFSAGVVPPDGSCVAGFDNAGFVMGTSSSLFNTFLMQNLTSAGNVPTFVVDAITSLLEGVGERNNDIAQWSPNPFYRYRDGTNPSAASTELSLVDGGLDLQNIPLHPLLQPQRGVDVIFAVDSSADTEGNWPNATALRATYERTRGAIANGTKFPVIPDAHTVINLGLNRRPTFFGCNATASGHGVPSPNSTAFPGPLIVYMPNAPYTAQSNVSTFTASYPTSRKNDLIRNGLDAATQGNGTVDAGWPVCVACAVLSRAFVRTSTPAPEACRKCFEKYCWDGTVDSVDRGPYDPGFIIRNGTTVEDKASGAALRVGESDGRAWTVPMFVVLFTLWNVL